MSSTNEEMLTTERKRLRCFIIGPIGNRFASVGTPEREYYEEAIQVVEEVIVPACEAVGLAPIRGDGIAQAGEITEQIFRRLRDDDVVVADLTGANANVMYELGLRHTRNMLTVQIGEYGRLPFDINVIRTVQFSRSTHGLITARNELVEILETGLSGEFDPVSATRVWIENAEPSAEAQASNVREDDGSADLPEPPGFMDLIADAEDNQQALSDATQAIAEHLADLGRAAEEATARSAKSDAKGAGMRGRVTVATQYASQIDKIASQLEVDVSNYEAAMASVSAGNLALIERIEEDPTQLPDAMDVGRLLRQLAAQSREAMESQQGFTAALTEAARGSRVMRGPTRRVVSALNRFVTATQSIDEWDRRLQALGVEVPAEDWEYPDSDAADAD
jgi:hypothetical protein